MTAARRRGPRTLARFAWDDARFLLRHGARTLLAPGRGGSGRHGDGERAEPVRVTTARRALAHVPQPLRGGALVDVGCGRGRLLLVALDQGYSPVIGVEVDPGQARIARQAVRGRAGVVVADAATWPFPDEVDVVVLANPFGPMTLADVLLRIRESRERRPRPVAIVYINPVHLAVVSGAGYRAVWTSPDVTVLSNG